MTPREALDLIEARQPDDNYDDEFAIVRAALDDIGPLMDAIQYRSALRRLYDFEEWHRKHTGPMTASQEDEMTAALEQARQLL